MQSLGSVCHLLLIEIDDPVLGGFFGSGLDAQQPSRPDRLENRVQPAVKPPRYHHWFSGLDAPDGISDHHVGVVPEPFGHAVFHVHEACGFMEVGMGEAGTQR